MEKCVTEITKIQLLGEYHNNTIGDYYEYLAFTRTYNESRTLYRRAKFVFSFDGDDLWDWYRDEEDDDDNDFIITKQMIKDYRDEVACAYLCPYEPKDFSAEEWKKYINFANETIEKYNKTANCVGWW